MIDIVCLHLSLGTTHSPHYISFDYNNMTVNILHSGTRNHGPARHYLKLGFGALENGNECGYEEIIPMVCTFKRPSSFVASIMFPFVLSLPVMKACWPLSC